VKFSVAFMSGRTHHVHEIEAETPEYAAEEAVRMHAEQPGTVNVTVSCTVDVEVEFQRKTRVK
jgi:hypothetical protein